MCGGGRERGKLEMVSGREIVGKVVGGSGVGSGEWSGWEVVRGGVLIGILLEGECMSSVFEKQEDY